MFLLRNDFKYKDTNMLRNKNMLKYNMSSISMLWKIDHLFMEKPIKNPPPPGIPEFKQLLKTN